MLTYEDIKELNELTPRQKAIVLGGLINKLNHHKKTGKLSYQYDVCPVCNDMHSTEERPQCKHCYIQVSCQAPFNRGFKDDVDKGVEYFSEMREFLETSTKIHGQSLIVSGSFDNEIGWSSGMMEKLSNELGMVNSIINGGKVSLLKHLSRPTQKFVMWMPNVDNAEEKVYPKKSTGAILICSKLMHEGVTRYDAMSRIFEMQANAVLEIYPYQGRFRFCLVDALGYEWSATDNIKRLACDIFKFTTWVDHAIRLPSINLPGEVAFQEDIKELVELTRYVADSVELKSGERYFGNTSTRCLKMFPSCRGQEGIFVSPRNIDKRRIAMEDFIWATMRNNKVHFIDGQNRNRKPSVDTPVQIELYNRFPNINYMIHGHAYVVGAPTTNHYFPCGDMREVQEVKMLIDDRAGVINLKSHGFLLYSETINDMRKVLSETQFIGKLPK